MLCFDLRKKTDQRWKTHCSSGNVKHELRVTSLNPRVTSSNAGVTSSIHKLRVQIHESRVQFHEL